MNIKDVRFSNFSTEKGKVHSERPESLNNSINDVFVSTGNTENGVSSHGLIKVNEGFQSLENSPDSNSAGKINISVLHLNDFHGAVEPMIDPAISETSTVGGAANIKAVLDNERAKNPEGSLTVNAGDLAEGSMIAYITKGKVVADAFKEMHMDATTLGNHDFAWGQGDLRNMLEGLDTPVVAANVVKTSDGKVMDGVKPYIIKDIKGVKVGIIGLDTPEIEQFIEKSKLKGLHFDAAAKTVRKCLPEVKKDGADLVMVLSHLGASEDEKLAEEVKGIDVIVGGHSHTVMEHGRKVGDTIIVQAGALGKFVGKLDLEVDPDTKQITEHHAELIPVISDEIKPDPEVEKILAPYIAHAEKVGAAIMGEALEDIHYEHREVGKLNQIHADSILEKSGAPFGICNSRTLRGHVKKGAVTRKELYSALPFTEEGFVTLKIEGKNIRKHIEDCLADGATELAVPMGALKYQYDPSGPSGERLVSLKLDGNEMEDDREYFICLNETMSRHDNFSTAREIKKIGSSQEEFFNYFTAHSPWDNKVDDRVTIVKS